MYYFNQYRNLVKAHHLFSWHFDIPLSHGILFYCFEFSNRRYNIYFHYAIRNRIVPKHNSTYPHQTAKNLLPDFSKLNNEITPFYSNIFFPNKILDLVLTYFHQQIEHMNRYSNYYHMLLLQGL